MSPHCSVRVTVTKPDGCPRAILTVRLITSSAGCRSRAREIESRVRKSRWVWAAFAALTSKVCFQQVVPSPDPDKYRVAAVRYVRTSYCCLICQE
jgi:hypothetical protein